MSKKLISGFIDVSGKAIGRNGKSDTEFSRSKSRGGIILVSIRSKNRKACLLNKALAGYQADFYEEDRLNLTPIRICCKYVYSVLSGKMKLLYFE